MMVVPPALHAKLVDIITDGAKFRALKWTEALWVVMLRTGNGYRKPRQPTRRERIRAHQRRLLRELAEAAARKAEGPDTKPTEAAAAVADIFDRRSK
jgi:hypothetical protein